MTGQDPKVNFLIEYIPNWRLQVIILGKTLTGRFQGIHIVPRKLLIELQGLGLSIAFPFMLLVA